MNWVNFYWIFERFKNHWQNNLQFNYHKQNFSFLKSFITKINLTALNQPIDASKLKMLDSF